MGKMQFKAFVSIIVMNSSYTQEHDRRVRIADRSQLGGSPVKSN